VVLLCGARLRLLATQPDCVKFAVQHAIPIARYGMLAVDTLWKK